MDWTDKLSVGIEIIDTQHKELFLRINDLVAAIKQSVCKYKIGDVVKFLGDYIIFHFGEEESRRIIERANNEAGYLLIMPFLLAKTVGIFNELFNQFKARIFFFRLIFISWQ